MKSWALAGSVLLLAFVGLIPSGQGFLQELWLYNDQGDALYFTSNVADLSEYRPILDKVTRGCATGWWNVFPTVNYTSVLGKDMSFGSASTANVSCNSNPVNGTLLKSLRHWGASDTSTDAISLYAGDSFDGEEILVTAKAKTDIPHTIFALSATGTSSWMLFEGKNLDLDGIFTCFSVPQRGLYFNWTHVKKDLMMQSIGSVYRGCDIREIQAYKTLNNL